MVASPAQLAAPQRSKASKPRGLCGIKPPPAQPPGGPGEAAVARCPPRVGPGPAPGCERQRQRSLPPSFPCYSVLRVALGGGCSADALAVRALPRVGALGGGGWRPGRRSLSHLSLQTESLHLSADPHSAPARRIPEMAKVRRAPCGPAGGRGLSAGSLRPVPGRSHLVRLFTFTPH